MQRWLPHPLLTLVLVLLWMALLNSFTIGGLVVGLVLGMLIPISTGRFWPERPEIRRPAGARFLVVSWSDLRDREPPGRGWIVFRDPGELRSRWIAVPLDLTVRRGSRSLAATITLTPGTVASDLSADGRSLLVHCLDVPDEQAMVDRIKQRYERESRRFCHD
jgi:multicomponent K+:H+ antiporter subunit E